MATFKLGVQLGMLGRAALGVWGMHFLRLWWQQCERGPDDEFILSWNVHGELPKVTASDVAALFAAACAAAATKAPFSPTRWQVRILRELDGSALTKKELAQAIGMKHPRQLYRPGYLRELMAQDRVKNDPKLGYYRPDAPPPELD